MDEDQQYDGFDMTKDFEGGQWVNGEFFYTKQVAKRKQTKEDSIYGIFQDSDSDEDRGKKKKKGSLIEKGDLTKPVNFVSKGITGGTPPPTKVKTEEDAPRAGLGSGGGLGFSGSGLGFVKHEDDVDDDEVPQNAFEKLIQERAEQRRVEQKEKARQEEMARKAGVVSEGAVGKGRSKGKGVVSTADLGTFEKHTKGIGMKLLEKMGYSGGGLGKTGQGIVKPIERYEGDKKGGLGYGKAGGFKGFGDDKEKEVKAEAIVKEAKPKSEKQWKKKFVGSKKVYKTVAQLLEERQADGKETSTQKIIDMRGAQVRVLANLDHMDVDTSSSAAIDDTPMPELQHNLRLIVDLAERDIQILDRKLRIERDTLIVLQREKERAKKEAEMQKTQLETLAAIVRALDSIESEAAYGKGNVDTLQKSFSSLQHRFKDEYKLYDIPALALSLVKPPMVSLYRGWNFLAEPRRGLESMARWQSLLATPGAPQDFAVFPDTDLSSSQNPFTLLLRDALLPPIQQAHFGWEPRQPEPFIHFLETWQEILTPGVMIHILHFLVLPRLTTTVDTWNPLLEVTPIHLWLHPWLPFLGASMEPLYQPLTYKLSKALDKWHPGDPSALALLAPWRNVFTPASWHKLLQQSILPKLATALHSFVINPQHQELEVFKWVTRWEGTLPVPHMVALLETGFFPQWHQVLYHWLSATPNFAEVTDWYQGWKKTLPPEVLANERVRYHLNLALEMMNQAIEGTPIVQPGVRENVAYLRVTEQQAYEAQQQATNRGSQPPAAPMRGWGVGGQNGSAGVGLGEADNLSLKESVQEFAETNDVQFLPKAGRMHEGLPVYTFGAVSIYIDSANQVIKAQVEDKWKPLSLEQLLEAHRKKGGRWG